MPTFQAARGRSILIAVTLFAPPLAACATKPPLAAIPASLRAPCQPAAIGALQTEADLEALILRQEGALLDCDRAKAAVIAIVDGPHAGDVSRGRFSGAGERRP